MVVVVVVVMLMMGVVVMLATAVLVVMMLLMVVVMFAVVVVMVAAVVVWALLVNCLLRVGRAQTFEARSLGCALAAQEGHNVALVQFDGVFEGSPSVAALQGVRGGRGRTHDGHYLFLAVISAPCDTSSCATAR